MSWDALLASDARTGAALLREHGVCWLHSAVTPTALESYTTDAIRAFSDLLVAVTSLREGEQQGLPEHLHRPAPVPA